MKPYPCASKLQKTLQECQRGTRGAAVNIFVLQKDPLLNSKVPEIHTEKKRGGEKLPEDWSLLLKFFLGIL